EGIYGTNVAVPAERLESASRFRERYQAAYAKEPPPYAVTTYEAMQVLLHAIEQADRPTREGVLAAVSDMEEFYGVLGRWQFDARGDISLTTISGMQIQDGAWTFFRILE
ncbi:MAG: ABC transporter substrate-binding protein, partial [Anaerolineae bacterium]|nr:ABC transporter substrate-binding protein [Anaerolineae bacterium]